MGAAALLSLALVVGFAAFLVAVLDPPAPSAAETDGIVVLTGGSERVATGFRLLAEGSARRMLISGAHPEAGLAEIATAAGVDPARFAGRVTIGHAAASTRGNAAEAAAWVRGEEARSLRIVTAGYHMPRAMLELRRALPRTELVPHPVPSAVLRAPGALRRPAVWALLLGEYGRYLLARAGLSGLVATRREMRDL
ncbi:YdcF family protein [Roseomonas eburnea]|uniref:YdcF family protein n=1 Tax=Neoroseomonas eburnea TaxID=1346889 RepID=A0A9X9XDI3_9PROT|nr:YdcF family protein [Neoroseomonas eburnea]